MKGKIIGVLSALVLAVVTAAPAHAADGFTIGGSFDGFGFYSRTDDDTIGAIVFNPAALVPGPVRGQLQYSELGNQNAVGSGLPINVGNAVPGDRDFGVFASRLSLNGAASLGDNVDLGFRVSFYATGGGNDSPAGPAGGFTTIVDQAFADFHNSDGTLGLIAGRLEPNIGTSLQARDTGSPYVGLVKSTLLPAYLTGAAAYFNSGDVNVAALLYNDLNGVNDQEDIDLGYGLAINYVTDEMFFRLNGYLSPEQTATGFNGPGSGTFDDNNELWVFIGNLGVGMNTDTADFYLDATYRREGWPTEVIESTEAFGFSLGGKMMASDMFGVGANLEWVHVMDVLPGTSAIGNLTNLFAADGNATVVNPYLDIALADTADLQIGWNWEWQKGNADVLAAGGGNVAQNIHTLYIQFTAELDSGAKSRTASMVALN